MNRFVQNRSGWITSIPGAAEVTLECLPSSPLIVELEEAGYQLEPMGEGERMIPNAITERLVRNWDGSLAPADDRTSTVTRTHAGIVRVERYTFTL